MALQPKHCVHLSSLLVEKQDVDGLLRQAFFQSGNQILTMTAPNLNVILEASGIIGLGLIFQRNVIIMYHNVSELWYIMIYWWITLYVHKRSPLRLHDMVSAFWLPSIGEASPFNGVASNGSMVRINFLKASLWLGRYWQNFAEDLLWRNYSELCSGLSRSVPQLSGFFCFAKFSICKKDPSTVMKFDTAQDDFQRVQPTTLIQIHFSSNKCNVSCIDYIQTYHILIV